MRKTRCSPPASREWAFRSGAHGLFAFLVGPELRKRIASPTGRWQQPMTVICKIRHTIPVMGGPMVKKIRKGERSMRFSFRPTSRPRQSSYSRSARRAANLAAFSAFSEPDGMASRRNSGLPPPGGAVPSGTRRESVRTSPLTKLNSDVLNIITSNCAP